MMNRILCVAAICSLSAGLLAQGTIPDELAIAKAAFQKKIEGGSKASLGGLNKRYAAGIEKIKDQAQAAGDLEMVLALTKELKSIAESGKPDKSLQLKDESFLRMREIYAAELRRLNNAQVTEFEKAKAEHLATLEGLVSELTKANRVDDALTVRSEVKSVETMTLASATKFTPNVPMGTSTAGNGRQGVLKGFGRLPKGRLNPNWEDFDLSPLQVYDDFVEIEGNAYGILFRRANGDVLNLKGEVVGKNAKRLFASYDDGAYVDEEGKFHPVWGNVDYWGRIGELKQLSAGRDYFFGINAEGELVWWGKSFDRGERIEPPERARRNLKKIGVYYDKTYALTKSGEVIGWSKEEELEVPDRISRNVRTMTMNGWRAFFINDKDELVSASGELMPEYYNGPAEFALEGGEFVAVLSKKEGWRLTAREPELPLANEIPVANVVMNRAETIDVDFHLAKGGNHAPHTASFLVWIEEPGAPPLDVKDVNSLPAPPSTPRQPGTGFFGVELD